MVWGMKNVKISLFGSSIMEGRLGVESAAERYYNILGRKLAERFPDICFPFFNGAVGGWSTRELMERADDFVLQYQPDFCVVMFGANNEDQSRPERCLKDGELEILMDRFEASLPAECQRIGVVLNPVIDEQHMSWKHPDWQAFLKKHGSFNRYLETEREKARKFYRSCGYPVVDLGELMSAAPEKFICGDGIHLSPAGHELFADSLFAVLEKLIVEKYGQKS